MAKVLIPRSDSISAKVIEPSDFESFFSDDMINDYVRSGFTLSAGSGLAVNIAIGKARLKGLFIHNDSASSKSSLSASSTNSIYITLTRDSNSEAESWDFTSNTTGTTPTDSLFIGTATTNGSSVTAVDAVNVEKLSGNTINIFGDKSDGDVTISTNTDYGSSQIKYFNNFTLNSGITLEANTPFIIHAMGTVTINGSISVKTGGVRGTGGSAGGGGSGGNYSNAPGSAGSAGGTGGQGGSGYFNNNGTTGGTGGNSGGGGASGGSGGSNNNILVLQRNIIAIIGKPAIYATSGAGGGGGHGGHGGDAGASGNQMYQYGGNGGAGGAGGFGGAGGGQLIIIANKIITGNSSTLSAVGEIGGNGGNGSNGGNAGAPNSGGHGGDGGDGAGGGGGGNGGFITLFYKNITDNGTYSVIGGTNGSGGTGGIRGNYQTASNGTTGAAATGNSTTGTILKLKVN